MKLTERQKQAVHATKGNVLVHAGAGSGKTSSYTSRVANLIANEGVKPESILGLTFTNEAAENMRDKLAGIVGKNKAKEVNLSTFHSFAYKILRQRYAGEYSNKTIMKGWWKLQQLWDITAKPKHAGDVGLSLRCKGGELGTFISYQKSNMIREGMKVLWKPEFDSYGERHELQKAFDTYCELVKNARLIDFDDMLIDLYYKLLEDDGLLIDLKDEFEYVMVDEFQDTNTVNLEILKLITDNNLFVVGDFRQGIYGFINANVENILDFTDTFEDVKLIELQDNFRSTDNIVEFANSVIDKSPIEKYKKFDRQVASRGVEGKPVSIKVYKNEQIEAEEIIDSIELGHDNGTSYEDYAIITRTNAQIGFYESLFADREIPVDVSNTKSFFDRREVSDLLAYAEHTVDEDDGMSMKKIMNSPNRFISKYDINQLDKYAYNNNISFEEACSRMNSGRSDTNIKKLVSLFRRLRGDIEDVNASTFLKNVYDTTNYSQHIDKTSATNSELTMKKDSIQRLFDIAKKFRTIETFLAHVSVIKNNNNNPNKEGVKIMTVHASKGLEFEHVFLPSVTEENFPHDMNPDTEEERRLFYVASSRAKNTMEISAPAFNPTGSGTINPSPFLIDVVGDSLTETRRKVVQGSHSAETEFSLDKAI